MKPRNIEVIGDIAYVPLTKGLKAVIDAADAPLVEGHNWHASSKGRSIYASRADYSNGTPRYVLMHRLILDAPDGLEVDHRSGDGLDNRRSNLRLATTSQNQHNQRLSKRNTSGFKGVYWNKCTSKWAAKIKLHGKPKHLGYYTTPELASTAYVAASLALYGEFARAA